MLLYFRKISFPSALGPAEVLSQFVDSGESEQRMGEISNPVCNSRQAVTTLRMQFGDAEPQPSERNAAFREHLSSRSPEVGT